MKRTFLLGIGLILFAAAGSSGTYPSQSSTPVAAAPRPPMPAAVDSDRLRNADGDVDNWLSYGRTYDEQRFSPLKQINAQNVSQVKLAWHFDLPTDPRAHESTPLIIDGRMYLTGSWSRVFALNASTGALRLPHTMVTFSETANSCRHHTRSQ